MIVKEKNGSLTINCKQGEVTMSMRSHGMVGKSYKTAQEAFKDATWSIAIERPTEKRHEAFLGLLAALFFVVTFGYIFWGAISRF